MSHEHPSPNGILGHIQRWVFTTNHKDIGTLYLIFGFLMFFVAGFMSLMIRAQLVQPGMQLLNPATYNVVITMHGLTMIFGALMPIFAGFANWQIPLSIGAPDMAFPRLNNWSFWLLPFGFTIMMSTLFVEGGGPNAGWTMYAPLSTNYGPPSMDYLIVSIHMLGISSILAAINIIATLLNCRAPGMSLMKMPIFSWSWLVTAFLLIAVMPVLAGTVTMMLTDRHFGTSFFNVAGGGDPLLFQHLFWFFGHPEVYILILPSFGIISEIVPTFSRKPLFGRTSMIYAILCIAVLSFIVWAHHMFTAGMLLSTMIFFMYTTMLVSVPTGIKVFNWVATMYKGALTFETPMLFAIGFISMFTLGGLTGLMLAIAPADFQYQDTYFVVGHFHYALVAGTLLSMFAGIYYWVPKWTGHYYSECLGKLHFWLSLISVNITFMPMHFLGLAGMPRRIPDYALQFADFNAWCTLGAFIFGFAQLIFVYNMIQTMRGKGKKASDQVWEAAQGLEWSVESPAPYHTFTTPPQIKSET